MIDIRTKLKKTDVVEDFLKEQKKNDMLLSYHKEQKKYKEKTKGNVPKKKASREDATLAMLAKFKQKLTKISEADDEAKVERVARNDQDKEDNDEDDVSGDSWMKNTLRFENNDPVLARDASTKDDDWYEIYDPRNPLNQRRREKDRVEGMKKEKDRRRQ